MEFKGLEKNSVIEWPGKIVSVAYVGQCNFRCPYCQNSDLVFRPDEIPTIEGEEVIEHLVSKRKWIDGLMITGGEPTLHSSLLNFCKKVKAENFDLGVETNGTNPEMLEKLIEENLVDYIGMDLKAPLETEKYEKAIGTSVENVIEKIKKCMEILRRSDIDYEYRTTVVPEILELEDLERIAEEIEKDEKYYIQQFNPENTLEERFREIDPYEDEELKKKKKTLSDKYGLENIETRNIR